MAEKRMSPSSWKESLQQLIRQLASDREKSLRIAIVGVGNELRCDDAAGMLVARGLQRCKLPDHVLVLLAGAAPENVTSEIRQFSPHLVLFVDTANMEMPIGDISLISVEQIEGVTASTHGLPLSMVAQYLALELDCTIALIGIQPHSIQIGDAVTAVVNDAVVETARGLSEICF